MSAFVAALACLAAAHAPSVLPTPVPPGPAVMPYVRVNVRTVLLRNVRLIDGTDSPAMSNRSILIEDGRVSAIGRADLAPPSDAAVLDLTGHTVIPGIVGMYDHMYYVARPNAVADGHSEAPLRVAQVTFSSPRLTLPPG